MAIATSVVFHNRGIGEEDAFQYPNVLDHVNKLWEKEAFAAKDFDWIQVCYNPQEQMF